MSRFNQPIILISSEDMRVQATLVALGNNQEKLTWVSADGISFTFDNGILIATRGYTQDLMALRHKTLKTMFIKFVIFIKTSLLTILMKLAFTRTQFVIIIRY